MGHEHQSAHARTAGKVNYFQPHIRVRRSCRIKATKTDKNRKCVPLLNDKNLFLSVFRMKPKKAKIVIQANSKKRQKVTKAKRKTKKAKKAKSNS